MLAPVGPARAAGIGLRWGSCEGTANRSFACDRSTGSEVLVGSFEPPSGVQITGMQAYLHIIAGGGNMPSWWQLYNPGSCRRGSISASFDVSDQTECEDPWSGQAMGGSGSGPASGSDKFTSPTPGGIDVWLCAAVPPTAISTVQNGRRYAAFKLLINHQKSNGSGACSGCDTPVCISFEGLLLVQPSTPVGSDGIANRDTYTELSSGLSGMGGSAQIATWQGGSTNCAAGMAKPSTWSELKSRFKSK